MYEMQGALPGLAAPVRPVSRPTRHRAPPAGARNPRKAPVARFLPRSRSFPRMVPVSNGEDISTPLAGVAQESTIIHF
jgi:hypothetical protein